MEWLKAILESNKKEDGTVDISKVIIEAKAEFPKVAVPKSVFNDTNEDLKAANLLVDDLKKNNVDVVDLQKKITDYETDIATLQTERIAERKTFTLKEKLKDVGAKDVDYMIYKLGDVELDKEGNIIELDNKIKSLVEANKDMFEVTKVDTTVDDKSNKNGFQVLDTKLEDGKEPDANQQAINEFEQALGLTQ